MRIQLFLRRLAEIADFYTTPMPTSEEEPRPKVKQQRLRSLRRPIQNGRRFYLFLAAS